MTTLKGQLAKKFLEALSCNDVTTKLKAEEFFSYQNESKSLVRREKLCSTKATKAFIKNII